MLGWDRLKKERHIIPAPLSGLCVFTSLMFLSYVCVHVFQAHTQVYKYLKLYKHLKGSNAACITPHTTGGSDVHQRRKASKTLVYMNLGDPRVYMNI